MTEEELYNLFKDAFYKDEGAISRGTSPEIYASQCMERKERIRQRKRDKKKRSLDRDEIILNEYDTVKRICAKFELIQSEFKSLDQKYFFKRQKGNCPETGARMWLYFSSEVEQTILKETELN